MSSIYLKIVGSEVEAYGDEASLDGAGCDRIVSMVEWKKCGCAAHVVNGEVVLGLPDAEAFERNASIVREERRLRLEECDGMNPMRWEGLTEEQKQAWRDYRQALLDITDKPGFPWNGNAEIAPWPKQPE